MSASKLSIVLLEKPISFISFKFIFRLDKSETKIKNPSGLFLFEFNKTIYNVQFTKLFDCFLLREQKLSRLFVVDILLNCLIEEMWQLFSGYGAYSAKSQILTPSLGVSVKIW